MADDLIEHFERLAWARAETKALESESAAFIETRPFSLTSRRTFGQVPRKKIVATATTAIPLGIIIRTGCIVNELRSTLDALACTLAARNQKTPKGVAFPIADNESAYDSDKKIKDKIAKLSPTDRISIRALKPWDGQTGNRLLCALHHADITRKHRRLIFMRPAQGGGDILSGRFEDVILFPEIGGDMSKGVVIADMSGNSHVRVNIDVLLCFSEPPFLAGKNLVPTLYDFATLVEACLKPFN